MCWAERFQRVTTAYHNDGATPSQGTGLPHFASKGVPGCAVRLRLFDGDAETAPERLRSVSFLARIAVFS